MIYKIISRINVLWALSRHFFHLLPCTLFPPLRHVHASTQRGFEMEWEFSFRISFPVIIIFCQEEKQSGSYAILCWTPTLSGRGKRVGVTGGNTDAEGWKEHRKGDPHKCLAKSDLLNGFPLSGYRESGWEGSSVLPTPFEASVHRHGHSVATRLHTPLLTVQGSK